MAVLKAKVMSFFLAVVFILLALPLSVGHNAYVSPDQDTRSGGTINVNASGGGDYTHIQWAIDNASDGDTVFVEAGTYYEHVTINKQLTLVGAGLNSTRIDGFGKGTVMKIKADRVNIHGFNITNASYGIDIENANLCLIENNIFIRTYKAINLYMANGNTIVNNICYSNTSFGLYFWSSNNNIVANNTCLNNIAGIYLSDSTYNTITDNTMTEGGIKIEGGTSEQWNTHTINTSNTLNNKPIYYWKDVVGGTIPSHVGQVILANCSGVMVSDLLLKEQRSIELGFSSNCTIINNTVYFINLEYSSNNIIIKNNFSTNGRGITLSWGSGNTVINSNCDNNSRGIYLWYSDSNNIANNVISNSSHGIFLHKAEKNTVANNTCRSNHFGIIIDSSNNTITNNKCNFNEADGIRITGKYNNIISNVCNSNDWWGIYGRNSDENTITGNICNLNHIDGIFFRGFQWQYA